MGDILANESHPKTLLTVVVCKIVSAKQQNVTQNIPG